MAALLRSLLKFKLSIFSFAALICLPATPLAGESQIVTPGKVMAWGYNFYGQTNIPATLTNAIQVSGGAEFSLALLDNFVVKAVPSFARVSENDLSAARFVSAGWQVAVSIRPDGGVNGSAYVDPDYHPFPLWSPAPRTVSLTMAGANTLAVQADGSVVTGGSDILPGDVSPLPGVSNVVFASAIGGGGNEHHYLLLDKFGAIREIADDLTEPFPGVTGFKSLAAGLQHGLALRENGTVVAWGKNDFGQTNVPVGLSNVVAITAGYFFSAALRSDGKVVVWGEQGDGEGDVPPGISFKAIAAGPHHMLGIVGTPSVGGSLIPLQIQSDSEGIRLFTLPRMDGLFQFVRSTDLTNWTALDLFSVAGNPISMTNSDTSQSPAFYRLKKP